MKGKLLAQAGLSLAAATFLTLGTQEAQAQLNPPQPDLVAEGIIQGGDGLDWAIALGKALFWDPEAGSDGMACASCHFSAGTDSRFRNQLSPGFNAQPTADTSFGAITDYDFKPVDLDVLAGQTASGGDVATEVSAYEMNADDFPFHQLDDITDRNSDILVTTNDVMSSAGSFDTRFRNPSGSDDPCTAASADIFHVNGRPARMVEPRNTPTTINAVFNFKSFWDGRANNVFNGVKPFGRRDIANDPTARILVLNGDEKVELDTLEIENASLASQAVAPVLSNQEMSCDERPFAEVARHLLHQSGMPLRSQTVHQNDSVFGTGNGPSGSTLRDASGVGLNVSYETMIENAFQPEFWAAEGNYKINTSGQLINNTSGYTQKEMNFSMFWGISIMLYEATLISDQSKFDTWLASCDPSVSGAAGTAPVTNPTVSCNNSPPSPTHRNHGGFTAEEVLGFALFNMQGSPRADGNPACSTCHARPLFSEAQFEEGENFTPVEFSRIDDPPFSPVATGGPPRDGGLHDRGFFNIGTRPTSFDVGNGGLDPYGDSLSAARMFLIEQSGGVVTDPTGIVDRCNTPGLIEPGGTPQLPGCPTGDGLPPPLDPNVVRELVDGGVKTPTLRNIGLTAPYFHYGGYSSLRKVLELYARGGSKVDFTINVPEDGNTSGTGPLGKDTIPVAGPSFGTNVDFFIRDLKSTDEQIDALVAFLLTLTDPRVPCDSAPFDHPSLTITHGHYDADTDGDGKADDIECVLPAVGAGGYTADGTPEYCIPNSGDLFAAGMRNRLTGPPECREPL